MSESQRGTLPEIRHTLLLNAPIEKVWHAVATSEGLAAWLMPNDLHPPHRQASTWGDDWHVTFVLEAVGDTRTRFTLIHTGWIAGKVAPETGATYDVIRNRMDQGWESTVLPRLREVVEA